MTFFEKTADNLIAAKVGNVVHAIIENHAGFYLAMASSGRPIDTLVKADFWGHSGQFDTQDAAKEDILDRQRDYEQIQTFGRVSIPSADRTPWGKSQHATRYGDGVVSHSTAGHGGFKLTKKRNEQVHPALRSDNGYYEEDCDWAAVAWTFPELFSKRENAAAHNDILNWQPEAYEAITKSELKEGQSLKRDEAIFNERHANDYVVISATGKEHGVYCTATLGGKRARYEGNTRIDVEEVEFIVPADEYAKRSMHGFVIDPDRHQRLEAPEPAAPRM